MAYLYLFLNTQSKSRPFEYLCLTTVKKWLSQLLSVVGPPMNNAGGGGGGIMDGGGGGSTGLGVGAPGGKSLDLSCN